MLLPHPDAPTRHTNSPGATSSDSAIEGGDRAGPCPYTFVTSRSVTLSAPIASEGGPGTVSVDRVSSRQPSPGSQLDDLVATGGREHLVQQRQVVDAVEIDVVEQPDLDRVVLRLGERRGDRVAT